ncbi:MAG: hypothetical protein FJ225_00960 [Lentisphaerae bacterium]|nr:hypothetical protein [Lentisphaerota bacterium]
MAKTQITRKKVSFRAPMPAEAPRESAPAQTMVSVTAPVGAAGQAAGSSYTWAAIVAIVAILLFAALLLLQFSEYRILELSFPVTAKTL